MPRDTGTDTGKTDTKPGVYAVARPAAQTAPLVFDSPHSGNVYPEDFEYACGFEELEHAEDRYVDELFRDVTAHGAPLLAASFPRSYIDPNRKESDFDPAMFEDAPVNDNENAADADATTQVKYGTSLVRKFIRRDMQTEIYDRKLTMEELKSRVVGYHRPYHAKLGELVDETHAKFGMAVHVNCHSMPGSAAEDWRRNRPKTDKPFDIVIGTRDGDTADDAYVDFIKDRLESMGYKVGVNISHLRGAELVSRNGDPDANRHSIQIEINRDIYMDDATLERKAAAFKKLQTDLGALAEDLAAFTLQKSKKLKSAPAQNAGKRRGLRDRFEP